MKGTKLTNNYNNIVVSGEWDRFDEELPLSSSIINLLVECLSSRNTWLTKAPVSLAVKILVGQRIETFIQVKNLFYCVESDKYFKFFLTGDALSVKQSRSTAGASPSTTK